MTIKELPFDGFMASLRPEFAEDVRLALSNWERRPFAVVLFENLNFSSSHFGEQKVMAVGPGFTYETVEELEGKPLGDVPSVMMYATRYAEVPTEVSDGPH